MMAFPTSVLGATDYLSEHFTNYNLGQAITENPAGGGSTNWELWFSESDFLGYHPCSDTGGLCRTPPPTVGSFSEMGSFFDRTAILHPGCTPGDTCDGFAISCEYRTHTDFSSLDPEDHPCKLWNCWRNAKTISTILPGNRQNYQAYVDVAFKNIELLKWPSSDPLWDHLGIFIHVKRVPPNPYFYVPGSQLAWARFGCCIRPAPLAGEQASQRCFLQATNPINQAYPETTPFSLPGTNIANYTMYTLGVSITPVAGTSRLLARAAVQKHGAGGGITEVSREIESSTVDWIDAPASGFGYVSNCGAEIHVDKVVAQNLP